MKPVKRTERTAFQNGPKVGVVTVDNKKVSDEYDFYDEGGEMAFISDGDTLIKKNKKTDEEVKIEALNQAINMAKLFSDVSVDDVFSIAAKVAVYITK